MALAVIRKPIEETPCTAEWWHQNFQCSDVIRKQLWRKINCLLVVNG